MEETEELVYLEMKIVKQIRSGLIRTASFVFNATREDTRGTSVQWGTATTPLKPEEDASHARSVDQGGQER